MIALDVDSYQHRKKEFGRIKFPKFNPVGYAPRATFDAALTAAGYAASESSAPPKEAEEDEINERIPF